MFKTPDRHIPREWGQPRQEPYVVPLIIALPIIATAILLVCIPYGGEIGLGLLGIAGMIAVYRQFK